MAEDKDVEKELAKDREKLDREIAERDKGGKGLEKIQERTGGKERGGNGKKGK